MKVDIRDVAAMQALRPLEVVTYLRARSWIQQPPTAHGSVWVKGEADEQMEAVVPMDPQRRDFALRMGELLQTIAVAEDRSQVDVYSDLLTTCADVIRIRIDDPELTDGTLPIEAHAVIAQKVRDLLLAAACSALQSRAIWHKRKPAQAVDQVRRLRIGQTERGSYIITVISRVSPELHLPQDGQGMDAEPPYERKVTQMLATSLATLDQVSATAALNQEFSVFERSVDKGVSANLCDAVAGLWGDDDRNRNLEFTFSWSVARPVDAQIPRRINFGSDRIPIIREASRVMKERSPYEDYELDGAVVKLERAEGQPTGKVTIIGAIDGKPHRVSLELADPHYGLAIKAHHQQQPIHCVGTLVKAGRGYTLRDARDVSIENE
ncbi:MAG: hypothetical protein ACKO3T_13230 [Planctomycetaceae bacterium]